MSIPLTIGNKTVNYPSPGENPGWGEDATEFARLVTEALGSLLGPNDLLLTSANLVNNQATLADIVGFKFDTSEVRSIEASFLITRIYDSGASTLVESGQIFGNYDGTDFVIAIRTEGDDSGIEFDITNVGQMQFTSTNLANHVSSTIQFKAKTIDTP